MYFSYGHPDLPLVKGLDFDADSAFVIEASEKRDPIHYWLRDTMLVNRDTLQMEIAYMITDSLGNLVSNTDTITALAKVPYEKRLKDKAKEIEKWQKEQKKRLKKGNDDSTLVEPLLPPIDPLKPRYDAPASLNPDSRVHLGMGNNAYRTGVIKW